jgi:hypothetical protein
MVAQGSTPGAGQTRVETGKNQLAEGRQVKSIRRIQQADQEGRLRFAFVPFVVKILTFLSQPLFLRR